MNFGLICATLKEANVIIKDRRIRFGPKIQGYCFGKIEFEHFNIIIAISNIGPENAAKCCSLLIKYFSVDCVVNFGTCGAIDPTIEKGSVIIPDQLVFMGSGKQIIGSAKLTNKAQQILQSYFTTSKCERDCRSAVVLERTLASCIYRAELATCTGKTCHLAGEFPPPRRRGLPVQKRDHIL